MEINKTNIGEIIIDFVNNKIDKSEIDSFKKTVIYICEEAQGKRLSFRNTQKIYPLLIGG